MLDARDFGVKSARDFYSKYVSQGRWTRCLDCMREAGIDPLHGSECVAWARALFDDYFYNRVAQLTYTFPEDAKTSSGAPFWSPPKRFPTPIQFDAKDKTHVQFVQAAAVLRAQVFGIATSGAGEADAKAVAALAGQIATPEFKPKEGVKIETDPTKTTASPAMVCDESEVEALLATLEASKPPAGWRLSPIAFEKDDDTNFHMDWISAMANLRARNYGIAEVDKLQAKLIAGRIIPAIATATAVATGLVGLELYKVLRQVPLEGYRNTFCNLSLPLMAMAEPIAPKGFEYNDLKWTLWDRWVLDSMTVQKIIDWFDAKGLSVYSISCGPALVYNSLFPKHKERLGKDVLEVVAQVAKGADLTRKYIDLVVACEDEEGEDIDVPLVSIKAN